MLMARLMEHLKLSLSARRAWIEMQQSIQLFLVLWGSLSARRAWIEIVFRGWTLNINGSLSARRAWIEMISGLQPLMASLVALRKESVDRNRRYIRGNKPNFPSLSARRAWIEIF